MTQVPRGKRDDAALSNEQVTLVALFLMRGDLAGVDTEDVAIKSDEVAPDRFRWRKYPQHIDLGLVRNGLQDARKSSLVQGGAIRGWRLTQRGLVAARELASSIGQLSARPRLTPQERTWMARERSRLVKEPAFLKWKHGTQDDISDREALAFYRIDEYVTSSNRRERVERLQRAFEDDADLKGLMTYLSGRILV